MLDLAVENKIVQKSGAWFSYGDQRLGQGRENVRQFLRDNPELTQKLRREVIQAISPDWSAEVSQEPAAAAAAPAGKAAAAAAGGAGEAKPEQATE